MTATPVCACGRYSIGKCLDCGKPVCGLHAPTNGPMICREDAARRQAAARSASVMPDLAAAAAAVTAEATGRESKETRERQAIQRALDAQRSQLETAIPAFLEAAAHLPRKSVTVGSRAVDRPGGFLRRAITTAEPITAPAHQVYAMHVTRADMNTDRDIYVFESGHVLYISRDPYRSAQVSTSFTKESMPDGIAERFSVMPEGRIPFHIPGRSTEPSPGYAFDLDLRPRWPGLNSEQLIARYEDEIAQTTAWFLKQLASYLHRG
jgi:hypothetical protein